MVEPATRADRMHKDIPLGQLRPNIETANHAGCGTIRASRTSRWRAVTLVLVHVAVAAHIAHWYLTGRTLTPVEPSEAMQTLGSEALLNAGFVFFAVTILGTLIFGRFFCGWGCHIVALQDLCTWMLRRLGIPPKPFRSRLLMFMPLAAALVMFVLPTIMRLWVGGTRAPLQAHFTTDKFWSTFPDWPIALLTFLVCGFVIVYLLGNKGFCTYGCPYGGIFGLADKVAPGKIRVTDACDGCAHCTATCTSNVRVHAEVKEFGMVVNPGCMKCMDCVSVCPKEALYFGFGLPTIARRKTSPRPKKHYDYTWIEEVVLLLLFLVAVTIFRKLYDAIPFLLALGLAAISAYVLITAAQLGYVPNVSLGRLRLRIGGGLTRAGLRFLATVGAWLLFLGHSGLVQYYTLHGSWLLTSGRAKYGASELATPEVLALIRESRRELQRAASIGFAATPNLLADLGAACAFLGDDAGAESAYARAVSRAPEFGAARCEVARLAEARGDRGAAIDQLRTVMRFEPEFPGAHSRLANLLLQAGRSEEALAMLDELILRQPDRPEYKLTQGLTLAHAGDADRAMAVTQEVIERWPENADAHYNLGFMLANGGQLDNALQAFERTVELNPSAAEAHFMCAKAALRLSRWELVYSHLDHARRLKPYNREYVAVWASAMKQDGRLEQLIMETEHQALFDPAARFRLLHLYRAAGREEEANKLAAEFDSLLNPKVHP